MLSAHTSTCMHSMHSAKMKRMLKKQNTAKLTTYICRAELWKLPMKFSFNLPVQT